MASTCFGLRPSSGSLQLSLAKVILILKHSVRLRRYLLCGDVAACLGVACELCPVQSTAHSPFNGTAVAQWLRCFATNQKVAGSIPDGFFGIFH